LAGQPWIRGVWSGANKKAEIFLLPFSLFSVKVCIFAKINNKKERKYVSD